jgi:two-component system, NtrC family, sensor kinase
MPRRQALKDFEEERVIVFGLDKNDRVYYADREFSNFTGVPEKEIIGQSIRNFLHPYMVGTLNKTSRSFIEFAKSIDKDRVRIEFLASQKHLRNTLICEFRECEEWKKMGCELLVIARSAEKEKALSELIEFQRLSSKQLGSGVFDMMVSVDTKLQIKHINRECEKKLKCKESELVGKHINVLLAKERDKNSLRKAIEQTSAFQNAYNIKLEMQANGKIIHTLVNVQALRDDFNMEIGYSIFIRDIEDELMMSSTLQQIDKMGALGVLATGIAHQVKNYAMLISHGLTSLEVQISELFPETDNARRALLNHVYEVNKRLASLGGLMRHLMEYARHQEAPVFSFGIVNNVITQVVELVQDTAKMKTAVIKTNLSPDIPPFYFSPIHLEQAILNIVSNAIDAVPERNGEIVITSERDNDYVVVKVSDNGAGIPDEVRPHIFEAFQTTKPPGKGTGLGLTVALQMVSLFQGTIDFETEALKGTTFTIRLPIKKIPEIIQ